MKEAADIWEAIQKAQQTLAERSEKRSTSDWIDAIVNRVDALRVAGGKLPWGAGIIMNVWLIMSLQEAAKWKSVAAKLALELKADREPAPPAALDEPPDGPPPEGTMVAILLQEGLRPDLTEITRDNIMSTAEALAPGQPVGGEPGGQTGTILRRWVQEVDGKLVLSAWITPVAAKGTVH